MRTSANSSFARISAPSPSKSKFSISCCRKGQCRQNQSAYPLTASSRHQLAKLCGYPSYSHRALDNTLLNTPEQVTEYLEQIMNAIRPLADRDLRLMQILKNGRQSTSSPVAPWDVARLEAQFRAKM